MCEDLAMQLRDIHAVLYILAATNLTIAWAILQNRH